MLCCVISIMKTRKNNMHFGFLFFIHVFLVNVLCIRHNNPRNTDIVVLSLTREGLKELRVAINKTLLIETSLSNDQSENSLSLVSISNGSRLVEFVIRHDGTMVDCHMTSSTRDVFRFTKQFYSTLPMNETCSLNLLHHYYYANDDGIMALSTKNPRTFHSKDINNYSTAFTSARVQNFIHKGQEKDPTIFASFIKSKTPFLELFTKIGKYFPFLDSVDDILCKPYDVGSPSNAFMPTLDSLPNVSQIKLLLNLNRCQHRQNYHYHHHHHRRHQHLKNPSGLFNERQDNYCSMLRRQNRLFCRHFCSRQKMKEVHQQKRCYEYCMSISPSTPSSSILSSFLSSFSQVSKSISNSPRPSSNGNSINTSSTNSNGIARNYNYNTANKSWKQEVMTSGVSPNTFMSHSQHNPMTSFSSVAHSFHPKTVTSSQKTGQHKLNNSTNAGLNTAFQHLRSSNRGDDNGSEKRSFRENNNNINIIRYNSTIRSDGNANNDNSIITMVDAKMCKGMEGGRDCGGHDTKPVDTGSILSRRKRDIFGGWMIFPGTKWCGDGDIADHKHDLGHHAQLDSCCRSHDLCKAIIPRLSIKYGIFNYRPHTLSHCRCDRKFRKCLQATDTPVSTLIGGIYFNVVGPKCFKFRRESTCVVRFWWGGCRKLGIRKVAYLKRQRRYRKLRHKKCTEKDMTRTNEYPEN